MTRVRKLAVGIASWVCRNSPAGAKDWSAASERELEHIGGDWEALRWAIGSTSVLWTGRSSGGPIKTMEQVPALARCMARVVRRRTVLCAAIVLFQAYWCTYYFADLPGFLMKTGAVLTVAAGVLMAVQAYLRRWRSMPQHEGDEALVVPLRAELARQREFHSGGWLAARLYALFPGILLMCCGVWTTDHTLANAATAFGLAAAFAVLAGVGIGIQLRTAEGFQRQIDALDGFEGAVKH